MTLTCQFCGNTDLEDIQIDKYDRGFWCEVCDEIIFTTILNERLLAERILLKEGKRKNEKHTIRSRQ